MTTGALLGFTSSRWSIAATAAPTTIRLVPMPTNKHTSETTASSALDGGPMYSREVP